LSIPHSWLPVSGAAAAAAAVASLQLQQGREPNVSFDSLIDSSGCGDDGSCISSISCCIGSSGFSYFVQCIIRIATAGGNVGAFVVDCNADAVAQCLQGVGGGGQPGQ